MISMRSLLLTLVSALFLAPQALAQSVTGWSYQGQLQSLGSPANGDFAMSFVIWDAPTGGTSVGDPLVFDGQGGNPGPIQVADGVFSVVLDWAAQTPAVFNGGARWLEITVEGTPLTPRQSLTSTPYALFSGAPWATAGSDLSYTGGRVGIGTSQPNTALEVSSGGDTEIGLVGGNGGRRWTVQSSGGNPDPWLSGSFQIIDRTANASRMMIDGQGNVGIGTTSPDRPLTVVGNTGLFGDVRIGSGFSNLIVSGNALADNVGINTYPFSPQSRLHVVGDVRVDAGSILMNTGILQVGAGGLQFGQLGDNSDPIQLFRSDAGTDHSRIVLNIGDNPGAAPPPGDQFLITAGGHEQFRFRSDGYAAKTGAPVWGALSDARAKHDIEPLTGSLDRLMRLEGHTFYYNEPNQLGARPGLCTGFVAQEVEPVFPDWVSTDRDGMKIMQITGFEALAVEALRELREEKDAEIAALERDSAALRDENTDLRERLEALERMVAELAEER